MFQSTIHRQRLHRLLGVLVASLLSACGGGGSAPGGQPPRSSALVTGAVQSTSGGLAVNGVAFATAGARLTSSDEAGPITLGDDAGGHLRRGMVVTVRGRLDDAAHGEATEIEFHDPLEGEVEAHGPGEVVVSGVHVSLDGDAELEDQHGGPVHAADLAVGTRVAISGHADSRGGLRATLVRERAAEAEQEVRGIVVAVSGSVLDLAFLPGGPVGVRVDVSGIVPAPAIAVGTLVEVKTSGAAVGGVSTAVAIHAEAELEAEHGDEVEVEGIVSAGSAAAFTVAGQQVVTDASTAYEGGTPSDVAPGAELEAEGALQADGSLLAARVRFRAAARLDANVDALDLAAGTLTTLGITVRVTPSTELEGVAGLAGLAAGDEIEVRGIPAADGGVDAIRLALRSTTPADRAFLRGVVTAKSASGVSIVGVPVDLTGASANGYPSLQALLDAVTVNQTVVKVRWRPYPASTTAPVDEVEIDAD
jgi:hypothetical protein